LRRLTFIGGPFSLLHKKKGFLNRSLFCHLFSQLQPEREMKAAVTVMTLFMMRMMITAMTGAWIMRHPFSNRLAASGATNDFIV
jgi:hypothetical protein